MMADFELQVVLRGPERENGRGYLNRETLAELKVPVDPTKGWKVYQDAVAACVEPNVFLFTPEVS